MLTISKHDNSTIGKSASHQRNW